jgi:Na+-translocating ferredoxin:NAD+ oxidoreductase RNF subunit RnfB
MEPMLVIALTFGLVFGIAALLGLALGFFREKFKVERDPLVDKVFSALPNVNCGACGYPGCAAYAEAVAAGAAPVNLCTSGGKACTEELGRIMGVAASAEDMVAVLLCQGIKEKARSKGPYDGIENCRAAKLSTGSVKLCAWGCQGFGDCTKVCKFDAIHMEADGLPHVDYSKCVGCGMCVAECPQRILALIEKSKKGTVVRCSNRNPQKAMVAKHCTTGCIKCGLCVRSCPEQCIEMVNGIPKVDYSKCTSCGVCVSKCPTSSFRMIQKDIIQAGKEEAAALEKEEAV